MRRATIDDVNDAYAQFQMDDDHIFTCVGTSGEMCGCAVWERQSLLTSSGLCKTQCMVFIPVCVRMACLIGLVWYSLAFGVFQQARGRAHISSARMQGLLHLRGGRWWRALMQCWQSRQPWRLRWKLWGHPKPWTGSCCSRSWLLSRALVWDKP